MQNTENPMLINQMNDCIQDCLNCHTVCLDTAMRTMQKSGNADNVRTLLDCAEICQTSAHFMLRNSPLHTSICQVCAMICQHCEEMCRQIGENDCANACRACANSCQQMSKMVA